MASPADAAEADSTHIACGRLGYATCLHVRRGHYSGVDGRGLFDKRIGFLRRATGRQSPTLADYRARRERIVNLDRRPGSADLDMSTEGRLFYQAPVQEARSSLGRREAAGRGIASSRCCRRLVDSSRALDAGLRRAGPFRNSPHHATHRRRVDHRGKRHRKLDTSVTTRRRASRRRFRSPAQPLRRIA